MECVLTKAGKKFTYAVILLAILALTSLILGCDAVFIRYPYEKAECWSSSEPALTISYIKNDNRTWTQSATIEWNGILMDIDTLFRANIYAVYPDGKNSENDVLFSGTWEYRNGNLVLIIIEDFVFENQFHELILTPGHGDASPVP